MENDGGGIKDQGGAGESQGQGPGKDTRLLLCMWRAFGIVIVCWPRPNRRFSTSFAIDRRC